MYQRTVGDAIYAMGVMAVMLVALLTIGLIVRWIVTRRR